jgi:hypothetical protein
MYILTAEFEGMTSNIAIYDGIELEELIEILSTSLNISENIIGLRDPTGILRSFFFHYFISLFLKQHQRFARNDFVAEIYLSKSRSNSRRDL